MRILAILENFLTEGMVRPTKYPDVVNQPISNMIDWINNTISQRLINGTTNQIGTTHPQLIFMYKIMAYYAQTFIQQILLNCYQRIFNFARTDATVTTNNTAKFKRFIVPFNDAYIYRLLNPAGLDVSANDPYAQYASNVWTPENELINRFNTFIENVPDNIRDTIFQNFYNDNFELSYTSIETIRRNLQTFANDAFTTQLDPILNGNFKNMAKKYLGITKNIPAGQFTTVPNMNIINNFNTITNNQPINDIFDDYLARLQNNNITALNFLTEFYSNAFVRTKYLIGQLLTKFQVINRILADIISFVNNELYYYIAQIFLPALFKQIILNIQDLTSIRIFLDTLSKRKGLFLANITSSTLNNSVLTRSGQFMTYVESELDSAYSNISSKLIDYHNTVIDFLNATSAYQLIRGRNIKNRLFTMNLVPIEALPDLASNPDLNTVLSVLKKL